MIVAVAAMVVFVAAGTAFAFWPRAQAAAPSAEATTPAGAGPTPSPSPDAAFTLAELRNATLDIPQHPRATWCGGQRVTFTDGRHVIVPQQPGHPYESTVLVSAATTGDVYGEGRDVTVLVVLCSQGDSPVYTIVVLDRGPRGEIITRDVIRHTTEPLVVIAAVQVLVNGAVDIQYAFPLIGANRQEQWRTFNWTGSGFTQSAGPTSFAMHPEASEVVLSATPIALTRAADGRYRGRSTVTVGNEGVNPATTFTLSVVPPAGITVEQLLVEGQPATLIHGGGPWAFNLDVLAPGATRTMSLDFVSSSRLIGTIAPCHIAAHAMIDIREQNRAEVPVTFA